MNSERSTIVFNQKAGNGKAKMLAGYLSDSLKGAPVVPFEQFLREKNHNGHVDVVWSIGGDGSHTSVARGSRNGEATPVCVPMACGTVGLIPKILGTDRKVLESPHSYVNRLTAVLSDGQEVLVNPGVVVDNRSPGEMTAFLWTASTAWSVELLSELERQRGKGGKALRVGRSVIHALQRLSSLKPVPITVEGTTQEVREAIIWKYPLVPGKENPERGDSDILCTVTAEGSPQTAFCKALYDIAFMLYGKNSTGQGIQQMLLNGQEQVIFHHPDSGKYGLDSEITAAAGDLVIHSRDSEFPPYRLFRPVPLSSNAASSSCAHP